MIFKETLLLLKIQNKAIKIYIKVLHPSLTKNDEHLGIYQYQSVTKNDEPLRIMPQFVNLKIFMRMFHVLKPALSNMDENICFLDIHEKYEVIKLGCDWCSIFNGIFETVKQNLIENPAVIKKIDMKKIIFFNNYLDFVLNNRETKITDNEIEKWCKKTFHKKTNDLLLLSSIYLKLEHIELRWCPFKRSKEYYYRNKDNRYLIPTDKVIHSIGKILSEHETITCNNCPKIINENWKYSKSNKKSIFQPLLDYMMNEIKQNL